LEEIQQKIAAAVGSREHTIGKTNQKGNKRNSEVFNSTSF
jgi:hypothetical protein